MKKYFVTVDGNGFINHWTTVYHDGCIEVQAPEDLFTQIGYVKVIDGVAILDKEQLEKERENMQNTPPSDVERLQQENADLLLMTAELEVTMADAQKREAALILALAEGGAL
ncbi:hypothetical protein [Listeria fleischmannii]|uniref:Uncharacterized protein n=1 Tax=Listeria fleischmannii FSL S10-1203 TaxID=1265822 RepID=W7DYL2_9LIST|nr:hypothetical protein [Listeria fleischmannii]EUJ56618.1 hypothetical protein MCOL2_08831 [Listeria fleischmannii FSL S10-1203]